MDNEVRIKVVAEDKTKATFGGIKAGMKGVITGAAALGAGIAVVMFKASAAAREAGKVHAQTAAVIKSTGGAAGITAKQMEGMASRISALTGVDDELILSGENMLATFTNVRNDFKKNNMIFDDATMIISDMSVALGQDMKSSAMQVGKALNDPIKGITALKRVGVTFNEEQVKTIKHLVKTGKTAEAQKVILKELRKEFGGSAEAQATWADKAKVAAGNIEESFGDMVNKTFAPIGKWFVEVGAPAIEDFFKKLGKNKELKESLKRLGDAVKSITDKDFAQRLDDIAKALPGIVDGMAKAADSVGEFYDAIVAVNKIVGKESRGGMFDEKGPLGGFTKWVKKTWHDAATSFKEDNGQILNGVKDWAGGVVGAVSKLPGRFGRWVKRTWKEAGDSFRHDQGQIVSGVKGWVGDVASWIGKLPGRASSALSRLGARVSARVDEARDGAIRGAKDLVNRVVDWLAGLPGKAKAALSSLASRVGSRVDDTRVRVLASARDMVGRFVDRMADLVRQAGAKAGQVKGAILGKFASAGSWLYSKGSAVINGLLDGLKAPWNALTGWVSGIAQWIKDHKGPISLDRRLLRPAGVALMGGLLSGLKFGFKGVGSFVYKAGSSIADIISQIKNNLFSGFGDIKFGKLPTGGARIIGRAMAAAYGWTGSQWDALNQLWQNESGWNPFARNPSSGAFGIPQAWPASKLGAAGLAGSVPAQVGWGLRYIKGAYGNPINALSSWMRRSPHWYDTGGMLRSGGAALNASGSPERVLSPRQTQSFERLVRSMDRSGGAAAGATYITIHAPGVTDTNGLRRMLVDMSKRGELQVTRR